MLSNKPNVAVNWAILPAAGQGKRFKSHLPKQYVKILGKSVIELTIERMLQIDSIRSIVVPIARSDKRWQSLPIAKNPKITTVTGGKERCYSVMHALDYIKLQGASDHDWVLVHDVSRPCVSVERVNTLLKTVCQSKRSNIFGGLLGVPIRDTVKRVNALQVIKETVDRSELWLAHTPQIFRFHILYEAMQKAILENVLVTDEAAAVERLGYYPTMVKDNEENIKLTYPEDISIITECLTRQQT